MNRSSGFTLIEVVVSIGIFIVIMAAVALFESNIFSYQRNASNSMATVQDAQVILKTLSKEIRMASQASDGSYALQIVATDTLQFFADTNSDGLKERIRYSFVGNNLYRASMTPIGSPLAYSGTESTSTVLTDVVNASSTPVFSYFNGTYAGTTTGVLSQPVSPNDVRLIQINLTLNAGASVGNTSQQNMSAIRTYTADVTLRNLKDNL